ncbi:MAG: hypothetical protein IJR42_01295 [Paludibacteraceae bacterium]|nr:hypothetical protein [Paludibacteraceae bacterium]
MAQELWQIAKPFGRPRKFKTPKELWDAFIAYVEWAENNPITVGNERRQKQSAKRGEEKAQRKETAPRPYSLVAFRIHAGIKRDWATFAATYSKRSHDFCGVIQAIEESVRQQMVEQAMVGNYKENLVARINGISDSIKQEVKADVQARTSLSVGEAQAFLEELEKTI